MGLSRASQGVDAERIKELQAMYGFDKPAHESTVPSIDCDAHLLARVHRLDGSFERELPLPDLGTVGGFSGHLHDREVYFDFQGFLQPTSVYRWDFARGERTLVFAPKLPVATDAFETEQVRVPASDGAQVPVWIADFVNVTFRFGGTSLLIVVGVALDTMRQMEAQLMMRSYEGFLQ